ncbi:hypothetical protein C2G38_2173374 [Gigaspora rosea]|uniref:TLDc domain-containing protein n=1 Tax=Gigaspora rosea TaxID=44941 RepID=A0A397VMY1_9GLOM|nr:hypothetical protein C2G38_2173374 [Gigaspora rosea]
MFFESEYFISTQENALISTALENYLPHIRYFQIPSGDVLDHLQPYQQMLDKNLWDDIIKRFLSPDRPVLSVILPPHVVLKQILPPRTNEPFSKIINEAHAAEITSWIDKKADAYSAINNPYEFKLFLRGTRDGFIPASFWNLCDKQTNLVVVVKIKGNDEILGGYNPIGWDKPIGRKHMNCEESFIFSLRNVRTFDLMIYNSLNECWNSQYSYEKRIRNAKYYSEGRQLMNTKYFRLVKHHKF